MVLNWKGIIAQVLNSTRLIFWIRSNSCRRPFGTRKIEVLLQWVSFAGSSLKKTMSECTATISVTTLGRETKPDQGLTYIPKMNLLVFWTVQKYPSVEFYTEWCKRLITNAHTPHPSVLRQTLLYWMMFVTKQQWCFEAARALQGLFGKRVKWPSIIHQTLLCMSAHSTPWFRFIFFVYQLVNSVKLIR